MAAFRHSQLLRYQWKNMARAGPAWAARLAADGAGPHQTFRINWFSEEHLALQALDHGYGRLNASDILVALGRKSGIYTRIQGPSLPGPTCAAALARPPAASRRCAPSRTACAKRRRRR